MTKMVERRTVIHDEEEMNEEKEIEEVKELFLKIDDDINRFQGY